MLFSINDYSAFMSLHLSLLCAGASSLWYYMYNAYLSAFSNNEMYISNVKCAIDNKSSLCNTFKQNETLRFTQRT